MFTILFRNGLVKSGTNNLELRKFINETSQEFYEFSTTDKLIKNNIRVIKNEILNEFLNEFPDSRKFVTNRTFMKWIKKYASYNKYEYSEGNSNGQRWFTLGIEIKTNEQYPF